MVTYDLCHLSLIERAEGSVLSLRIFVKVKLSKKRYSNIFIVFIIYKYLQILYLNGWFNYLENDQQRFIFKPKKDQHSVFLITFFYCILNVSDYFQINVIVFDRNISKSIEIFCYWFFNSNIHYFFNTVLKLFFTTKFKFPFLFSVWMCGDFFFCSRPQSTFIFLFFLDLIKLLYGLFYIQVITCTCILLCFCIYSFNTLFKYFIHFSTILL